MVSLDGMDRIPDPARGARAVPPPAVVPAEPSPTRADRALRVRVAVALAILWVAGTVAAMGVRTDIAAPLALGPLLVWAAAVVVGLAAVLRPRARGLPAGIRVVQHTLWIVPALYVIVVVAAGLSSGPPFGWGTIRGCLAIANLVALGPLAAAAVVLQRSFLSASGWRGAAVGALAGLSGSLGVHAHCPVPAFDHLLASHGPSILLGAILGGILGRARGSA
jgi:hypothetical protein